MKRDKYVKRTIFALTMICSLTALANNQSPQVNRGSQVKQQQPPPPPAAEVETPPAPPQPAVAETSDVCEINAAGRCIAAHTNSYYVNTGLAHYVGMCELSTSCEAIDRGDIFVHVKPGTLPYGSCLALFNSFKNNCAQAFGDQP